MSCGTQGTARVGLDFAYGPITLFRTPFQDVSAILLESHVAALQPQRDESRWFGLFRFRSPLLAESLLISFPLGTEIFHFPRWASYTYVFSVRWEVEPPRVTPFGYLRIKGCLAPPRSFSQLATSFIASARLGIHRPEDL